MSNKLLIFQRLKYSFRVSDLSVWLVPLWLVVGSIVWFGVRSSNWIWPYFLLLLTHSRLLNHPQPLFCLNNTLKVHVYRRVTKFFYLYIRKVHDSNVLQSLLPTHYLTFSPTSATDRTDHESDDNIYFSLCIHRRESMCFWVLNCPDQK